MTQESDFTPPIPKKEEARIRLDFLDGLRGFCALYVVFHHVLVEALWKERFQLLPRWMQGFLHLFDYGQLAVSIFIVLSGYCLMLPVARSAEGTLRGGFREYIRRRARRILPPYYAALVLTLILIALVPGMQHDTGTYTLTSLPMPHPGVEPVVGVGMLPKYTLGVWVSHLFLVHNLSDQWIYKINPPMWSVSTEWEIYFIFPLLLLPLWKRLGIAALLVGSYILGLLPHFVPGVYLDLAIPYYIGLFAFGMAGAVIGFSAKPAAIRLRERLPWGIVTVVITLALVALAAKMRAGVTRFGYLDPLAGAAAVCLIIYCVKKLTEPGSKHPAILKFLDSRWLVWLGTFSYSLYLVHYPVLALAHVGVMAWGWNPQVEFWFMMGIASPLSVALSYLFHLAFERRFMSGPVHSQRKVPANAD